MVIVHDLSDLDSEIEVVQPVLDSNSTYDVRGDMLVMSNSTNLMIVDLSNPGEAKTTIDVDNPSDVEIVTDDCIAVLENGAVY